MTVELHPEHCECVTALAKEFSECRVAVNHALLEGLETACFVRFKVKRGHRTVRKKALDARFLIKCLQEERLVEGKVKLAFDITSFSPLTFRFHIKTLVSKCSMTERQPVYVIPGTACTALSPVKCSATTEQQSSPATPGTACTALPSAECSVTTEQQPSLATLGTACTALPSAEEDCRDAQETVEKQMCAPPTPNTEVTNTTVLRNITIPRRYRHRVKGRGGVVVLLREAHSVTIDYNERCGAMKLRGLADDVRRCQDNIDWIINTWQRENSTKQEKKKEGANGAKCEGKETTPRQEAKLVRTPDPRKDNKAVTTGTRKEDRKITTSRQVINAVRVPDNRQDPARQQSKAGRRVSVPPTPGKALNKCAPQHPVYGNGHSERAFAPKHTIRGATTTAGN